MSLKKCRCGQPRRAGQRNCRKCHREGERRRRERERGRVEQLRQRTAILICQDRLTQERFETKCESRFVLVHPEHGGSFAGYVVGYWPGGWLDVLDSSGALHRTDLNRVAQDKARSWIELATRELKLPELPPGPSLSCQCDGPRPAGKEPCRKCRREYQRAYRKAHQQQLQRWQRILEIMTVDNPATRAQFEATPRSGRVVVIDPVSDDIYSAKVIGFNMGNYVTVVDQHGKSHSVRLENVIEDAGWVEDGGSVSD